MVSTRRPVWPHLFPPTAQVAALQVFLSDEEIGTICCQLGHTWRDRSLPPGVTARSLVYRSLHPDRSIAAAVADLAAARAVPVAEGTVSENAPSASAWCQARDRLPLDLWPRLLDRSVKRLRDAAGAAHVFFGRPLYIFDGSTVSMPDTPDLVHAFGYARTKHGPSRFPVARFAVLLLAGVEAACAWRLDPYRTSEDAQFHALWRALPEGCICLFDKYLSSFYHLATLHNRGIDVLTRLHQRRRPDRLIAAGRRLGKDQWLVRLDLAPQLRRRYDDPSLPAYLTVRLIRVTFRHGGKRHRLWLVTTLLDPKRYPRAALVDLYRRRWGIETRLGTLKTTLALNVLRSKTALGVAHEVAATILAHNLVWTLIHQAARQTETPADRISFTGAVQTVLAFSTALRHAEPDRRRLLYAQMLRQIARRRNPYRPGRSEPRLLKRDPVRYNYLRIPRDEARRKCLT